MSSKATQAAWSGANRDNIRSFWWGYDALDRLIKSDTGHLDETGNPPIAASGPLPLRSDWTLDRLGNWTGDATHAGKAMEGDIAGNGAASTKTITHSVDLENKLSNVHTVNGGTPADAAAVYDQGGNLVADGSYLYQYDGLNRLVQVNQIGTLAWSGTAWTGSAGPWVLHYVYDGLGRLIRKQAPWPQPAAGETRVRTEHFYYDGVRRVQEVFTDPLEATQSATKDGVGIKNEKDGAVSTWSTVTWTEREYIWHADAAAGVDELVCQIAPGRARAGPLSRFCTP